MLTLSFLTLAALLIGVSSTPVHAEDNNEQVSISVTPSIIDKGGRPGEEVPFAANVTNNSSLVLPIHLFARPMLGMESEVESFLVKNNAQQWITFDNPDFLLDAGETKEISGTLTIPDGTGPEGFYADIVVRPLSMQSVSGTVHAQPELTLRLLTRVSGAAIEKVEANITQGSTIITRRSAKQPLDFSVKNTGNVHELVRPVLHITAKDRDVYIKDSGPMLLLPRETRRLSYEIPDTIKGGTFDAKLTFDYGAPKKTATSPAYLLIVLPFSPVIFLLLPIAVLIFAVWRYRSRFVRAFQILAKGDKAGN